MDNNFVNGDQALKAGMLLGHLMMNGVDASPTVDADGDYLPVISVRIPATGNWNAYTVLVKVEADEA